ncbi:galectin-2-like [Synchiropus picturatus]
MRGSRSRSEEASDPQKTDEKEESEMKISSMSIKEGQELKIRVKPKDNCDRFAINIGLDPDNIALHFNPRFECGDDVNVIVCNSKSGGCWGDEERDANFSFVRGEESKFYINFNMTDFFIKLPDGCMMSFPNRLGELKYNYIEVSGEARIVGLKIK